LFLAVLLVLSGLICGADPSSAGPVVYLDVPDGDLNVPALTPVFTARYRLARARFADQLFFKQPSPAGYPSADLLGIGSTNIGSATYDFALVHTAATSRFDFSLTNGVLTGDISFRSAGAANNTMSQAFAPNELDYNILDVFAESTTSGATAAFSNLSFTPGAGLATSGAMETSGSVVNGSPYHQWLASATGTNLDAFSWSFNGQVTLAIDGTRPGDEGLKFEFSGKRGEYVPTEVVPEPSTLALGAMALVFGGLGWARAQRRRG
jgi:hypothetical protein